MDKRDKDPSIHITYVWKVSNRTFVRTQETRPGCPGSVGQPNRVLTKWHVYNSCHSTF